MIIQIKRRNSYVIRKIRFRNTSPPSSGENGFKPGRSTDRETNVLNGHLGKTEELLPDRDEAPTPCVRKKPSLLKAIAKTYLGYYSLAGLLLLASNAIAFVNPLLLKYLYSFRFFLTLAYIKSESLNEVSIKRKCKRLNVTEFGLHIFLSTYGGLATLRNVLR